MKPFLFIGWLLLSCTAHGAPCLPGSLQQFIEAGAVGCQMDTVQFTNFTVLAGQTMATPLDPAQVFVTPAGVAGNPTLSFTISRTTNAGEAFESLFRFSALNALTGVSIGLTSPSVSRDAAIVALLDVCPNGSFQSGALSGCQNSPVSLAVFAIDQSSLLSASTSFASPSALDVILDLRLDGGQSGSAALGAATVGFSTVPEPSAGLLVALGLTVALVFARVRRRGVFPRAPVESKAKIHRTRSAISPFAAALAVSIGLVSQPAFGQLPWMNTGLTPQERTELLLQAMTLDEKIQQIANRAVPNTDLAGCGFTAVGRHIEGIPRLGIPTFRMINGGNGVRGGDCLPEPTATGFPSAPLGAATFNPALNFAWGAILGQETRDDAHHVLLGPALNLNRHPYNGRTQEYFSEDPFLAGAIGAQVTKGIQSRGETQAMIKHFAGNDDEGGDFERWTRAVRIPPRAMHELYLLPFEMAIRDANAASVMCAYPHLNLAYACENQPLLITTLRQRWGFGGYVESDRRAMQSTAPSIRAQVSVELDEKPEWYEPDKIKAALEAGEITMADIDELVRRRFVKMFEFGHFDNPYDRFLPIDYSAGAAVARQAAREGIVLLKNDGNFLPLGTSFRSIALIGAEWFAGMASLPPRNGDPAELATVVSPPQFTISPEQGLKNTLAKIGSSATVTYDNGSDIADAVALARQSDLVILMVGNTPRETRDLKTLSLPVVPAKNPPEDKCNEEAEDCPEKTPGPVVTDQEALLTAILAANPNTVVVLKTGGMVLMPWLNNVRALVEAWFPGQDDGDAVAGILFGIVNPSGKLPVTFGNSPREAAYSTEAQYPGIHEDTGVPGGRGRDPIPGEPQLVTRYTEDLQMGYRWYEANGVTPLFPFGFGLSYTTFAYSDLSVAPRIDPKTGHAVLTVTYRITNTGSRAGAEASQVYVSLPPVAAEPSKRLVGFQKIDMMPGASQIVTVTIDSSASNHPLSYFQPDPNGTWAHGAWITPSGNYTVHVGGSSADTPLQTTINMEVPTPSLSLRLVPKTLDLRGMPRRVTAVLSVSQPYSLLDLNISNVRFEGAPALTTALSTDGRAMIATFDSSRMAPLEAGQNVTVTLAADIVKEGVADELWVSTVVPVLKSGNEESSASRAGGRMIQLQK